MVKMSDNSCNRIKRGETRKRESGERVSAGEDSMSSADRGGSMPLGSAEKQGIHARLINHARTAWWSLDSGRLRSDRCP